MNRTICRSCGFPQLEDVFSLGNLYLSEFSKIRRKPKKYPLDLVLCSRCYLLQTKNTVPPELLYTENYGYRSGINNTMKKELYEIVEKAVHFVDAKKGDIVIDIGANDGTLLGFYDNSLVRIGVEPVKKLEALCKNHADYVVTDFFSGESYKKNIPRSVQKKKAKIITAISMFYDLDNPNAFVSDLGKLLEDDGICVIQQNYLLEMLQQNAFDNCVHEHLEYYSLFSMNHLFQKHNLDIFHVEASPINGGSFRAFICHKNTRKIMGSVMIMKKNEEEMKMQKKDTYLAFVRRIEKLRKELLDFISAETKKGKIFYILGASTRGNTLLQYYGLDKKNIHAAVERNPEKWGTYIASVGIPIISEEQARKEKPDYMIVLPWFFKEEIIQREKNYLNAGGHLIFPLPTVTIL